MHHTRHHRHPHDHDHHDVPGPGHNAPPGRPRQWQTPHRPGDRAHPEAQPEPDLDLVEAAFAEGFATASDPTSFLRLAGVPFTGESADGRNLHLVRVEQEAVTDVGALAPLLGGTGFRYDPLPAKLVSRRRRLRFIYADGELLQPLTLVEAKALRG